MVYDGCKDIILDNILYLQNLGYFQNKLLHNSSFRRSYE